MFAIHVLTALVVGSPFDPFPIAARPSGSFFDGWFLRVVDHAHGRSLAFIVGAYQPKGYPRAAYESSWVSVLVASEDGATVTEQTFAGDVNMTLLSARSPSSWPDQVSPPRFELSVPSLLTLRVDGDEVTLDANINGLRVDVHVSAPRAAWDASAPNGAGPEGALRHVPWALPCHYFVHSLASPARYTVHGVGDGVAMSGVGFAHLETNYGALFPKAWVWVQGIDALGTTHLLVTGGKFVVGGITTMTYIVAYRSPSAGALNFRTTDADSITVLEQDACAGRLSIGAAPSLLSALWKRGLHISLSVSASVASFSDPLFVPTAAGWSNDPGSVESFHARADVRVAARGSGAGDAALESTSLTLVALEFGGDFRCTRSVPMAESVAAREL